MVIDFWHGLQQGPILDRFEQIVHEWNIENQDEKVLLKAYERYHYPGDNALNITQEEQPCLVLAPEYMTSTMMQAMKDKKVIPLSALLSDEKGNEELKKIPDLIKKTFGDLDGNLASLPLNPACGVIYTNKDYLSKIGKDRNWVPKSMEELEGASKKMVEMGLVEFGYTSAWPAAYLIEIPAAMQNKPLATPENGKRGYGKYQLSDKWLVKHLKDMKRQQKENIYRYQTRFNDSMQPFVEGKCGFFLQGSTHLAWIESEVKKLVSKTKQPPFEVGCGNLPMLVKGQKEKYACPLGGASIWVLNNKKTKMMKEGVRKFLSHLASKEVQTWWHKETAYVPVNSEILSELKDYYAKNPLHKAVSDGTIDAKVGEYSLGFHMPNYQKDREDIFALIENILKEETTDNDVEALLKKFDKEHSIEKP